MNARTNKRINIIKAIRIEQQSFEEHFFPLLLFVVVEEEPGSHGCTLLISCLGELGCFSDKSLMIFSSFRAAEV